MDLGICRVAQNWNTKFDDENRALQWKEFQSFQRMTAQSDHCGATDLFPQKTKKKYLKSQ